MYSHHSHDGVQTASAPLKLRLARVCASQELIPMDQSTHPGCGANESPGSDLAPKAPQTKESNQGENGSGSRPPPTLQLLPDPPSEITEISVDTTIAVPVNIYKREL